MGFFFFVALPLTEFYLLLQLWEQIGFWRLVGLLMASAFIGVWVTRHEGLRVWRDYQQALLAGAEPTDGVLEGVLVLLGGALLIAPGPLSDLIGLILLLPWTRRLVARWLRSRHTASGGRSVFVSRTFVVQPMHTPRSTAGPQGQAVIETTGEAAEDDVVVPQKLTLL